MCKKVPLTTLAQVNPSISCPLPKLDDEVSFIPMQDVSDRGDWFNRQSKKLSSIGSGYTTFQEGDVLFAKITPCMENGKGTYAAGLVNGVGFGSTEFHVLRAKEKVSSRFLFHWCNSRDLRAAAEVQMTGSAGQKRVPSEFFSRYLVTLLEGAEQRVIAAILDTMDEAIRGTEALIAKLRQVKAGMLHDLITRGLDENGELRDPIRHPEQFKDSPLGRIPREWEIKGLLEVAPIAEGQVDPKKSPYIDYFLVAPDHIESGTGRLLSLKTAGEQGAISGKYRFQPCDVVYSKIRPYLRKVWLASFDGLCSADMYPFRPGEDINSHFLFVILLSERFSNYAISVSERSGFPKINRKEINFFKFPLPPKNEQERIAKLIKAINQRMEVEETERSKMHNIKQGLMHDLLTGRVRVSESMLQKYKTEVAAE